MHPLFSDGAGSRDVLGSLSPKFALRPSNNTKMVFVAKLGNKVNS